MATNPEWLQEQVRTNVRLLKSIRDMADESIAQKAGYTSRQVFSSRLSGRTEFSAEDFARVAAALRVEPHVLMMRTDEALRWVQDNPSYKPPRYKKQAASPKKARK
jgi:hypothetical protein